MKACQPFQEWLEQCMQISFANLPADLKKHVDACPHCAREMTALGDLRQQALQDIPSASEMEKIWNGIERKIWPAQSSAKTTPVATSTTESLWQRLLSFLNKSHLPASAGALALVALLVFWSLSPGRLPQSRGKVTGARGDLLGSSLTSPLTTTGSQWAANDQIALLDPRSWAEISFQNGRSITIEGRGRLQLSEDGFQTEQGHFKASFAREKGKMKVLVPGAALGIRGTAIQFDLQAGEGTLILLDGLVDVFPADGRPSFEWKPQTTLHIKGERLLSPVEPSPGNGSPPASGSLRQRKSEY